MPVVIAGGAAADVGGVCPAGWIGWIGSALEGLIQGGVIPLHAGINVRHHNAVTLEAEG